MYALLYILDIYDVQNVCLTVFLIGYSVCMPYCTFLIGCSVCVPYCTFLIGCSVLALLYIFDRMLSAQLVKRRTRDPKTQGSNPIRSTRKSYSIESFSESKCADSLSMCPTPCIRMITYAHKRSCSPCPSSVDYENTKGPSMHLLEWVALLLRLL